VFLLICDRWQHVVISWIQCCGESLDLAVLSPVASYDVRASPRRQVLLVFVSTRFTA
jgi:hypothetical protein